MASNSFKIKNSLVLTPKDLATLVSPEAGDLACDINDSNKIKRYDVNSASWVEVGSGGGVGGTDIFFVQDFESASLASFTQTGLTLSQTDPLHGKVSALLTHQAAVNQSFKQVIPVDRKFRGESMTLRLNCKSSASAGNVTIKIYDETNAANIVASKQLQLANDVSGAISQVGFTIPATCASISYTITALPQSGSPVTRIDDVIAELAVTSLLETVVELTGNAQTLTIPLTQSGLVQEADSEVIAQGVLSGAAINFTSAVVKGSSIALTNPSIKVLETGVYSISFNSNLTTSTTDFYGYLYINGVAVDFYRERGAVSGAGASLNLGYSGILTANDVITVGGLSGVSSLASASINVTKQGSLKQVSVSPDQKITIPTSELRFEGASSRGSTATAIVKFDTQAKLRGDAFTVESDSVLGTRITMKKAGKLEVSAVVYSAAAGSAVSITKNQATLSSIGANSEIIALGFTNGTNQLSISGSTFVSVGDVIRVANNSAPAVATGNQFNLSFQEQDISVSVTNTLPQFSESDSSVRVDTANGYGSAGTKIRRFSNVRDSIGVDVEYLDSATNGASFTVKSAGIYDISYSDQFNVACTLGISKNASSLTTIIGSLPNQNILAISSPSATNFSMSASWQGYLVAGDIIRAHSDGQLTGATNVATFTMSKVGKPNVTGVNVTPFVNVPQPEKQASYISQSASFSNATITGALTSSSGQGIYSYNSSTGTYTALKTSSINVSASLRATGAAGPQIDILKNGTDLMARVNGKDATSNYTSASAEFSFLAGETFTVRNSIAVASDIQIINVSATALSDQILTAPETFSTDTAALTYANAATYTLSTLSNAPVGTYITFTYAANTNTRTQTTLTNRPTQTDADMNANGMLIYSRAYNAASTAGNPAAFAIQIGKGLKGKSVDLYKSAAKTTAGNLDHVITSAAGKLGANIKDYDEKTGVLFVDTGIHAVSSNTVAELIFSDGTLATSGYLVINASKNPALTGIGLNRIAASYQASSGQSIPQATETKLLFNSSLIDTNGIGNTGTGDMTIPERGLYLIGCQQAYAGSTSWTISEIARISIKVNGVEKARSVWTAIATSGATVVAYVPLCTLLIPLAKGDIVSFHAYQESGAALSVNTTPQANQFYLSKQGL